MEEKRLAAAVAARCTLCIQGTGDFPSVPVDILKFGEEEYSGGCRLKVKKAVHDQAEAWAWSVGCDSACARPLVSGL